MASPSPALQRLNQTLHILDPASRPQGLQLSLVHGPVDPPLLNFTIGELLDFQADKYGDREALVVSWTGTRWTYAELKEQSTHLARGLLAMGIKPGDRIAIMAGNCEEYVAVFFAAARVGAILVVLNNTYTATEATYALNHTGKLVLVLHIRCRPDGVLVDPDVADPIAECKLLFIQSRIGRYDNGNLVEQLRSADSRLKTLPSLAHVVALREQIPEFTSYDKMINLGDVISPYYLYRVSTGLNTHDVCNLQFTSGSTGNPKAAMLTHQ